jgi:hypothetical protein
MNDSEETGSAIKLTKRGDRARKWSLITAAYCGFGFGLITSAVNLANINDRLSNLAAIYFVLGRMVYQAIFFMSVAALRNQLIKKFMPENPILVTVICVVIVWFGYLFLAVTIGP